MTSQPGFFERLRRPRTSTAGRDDHHAARIQAGTSERGIVASSDDVTTRSTSRNQGNSGSIAGTNGGNGTSRLNLVARATSGLPRSSSSSQVHQLPPREASTNAGVSSGTGTPRTSRAHAASRSQGNIQFPGGDAEGNRHEQGFPAMSRSGSSQSNSGSGGVIGLGRMLRRYSQGQGRATSNANEAARAAAVSSAHRTATPTRTTAAAGSDTRARRQSDDGRRSREISRLPGSSTLADITASSDSTPASVARNVTDSDAAAQAEGSRASGAQETSAGTDAGDSQQPPVHRIRLVPNLEATRSLHFEPIERDVVEGSGPVKIGRFTDRGHQSNGGASAGLESVAQQSSSIGSIGATGDIAGSALANGSAAAGAARSQGVPGARGGAIPSSAGGAGRVDSGRIAFKSKVVSRGHAEIWCEAGGKFFIKDTKSSSGTFLNHIRLSSPNAESRPHQIKDGDVVQLGVDYQGGLEEIYRCVKMRVELNRGWQRGANEYNINALRQLEALRGNSLPQVPTMSTEAGPSASAAALPTNREALSVTDCCICLYSVSVCQALFIAPCSHVYHYKCIRPLINRHFPGFQCPLCRTFADLEAEVERDDAWQEELLRAEIASREDANRAALDAITPREEIATMSFGAAAVQATQSDRTQPPMSNTIQPAAASQTTSTANAAPEQSTLARHPADVTLMGDEGSNAQPSTIQTPVRQPSQSDTTRSNPIAIGNTAGGTPSSLSQTQRFMLDGFGMSPGFNDAGTPQNEHFLSTLAEAPPPPHNAFRALTLDTNSANRNSVHEVYSTPAQGNSPLDTSTLDAVMTARGSGKRASPANGSPAAPVDGKGKAPQAYNNGSLNGYGDGTPSRSIDGRNQATPVIGGDKLAAHNSSHARVVSDDEDDEDSSRGTHRTGGHDDSSSSSGGANGSQNDTRSGSSSGVLPATNAGATVSEGVQTPSSPGSTGKLARIFKRPSSALQP